eukprot:7543879-Alexandrium_andersonii.AAC.1
MPQQGQTQADTRTTRAPTHTCAHALMHDCKRARAWTRICCVLWVAHWAPINRSVLVDGSREEVLQDFLAS